MSPFEPVPDPDAASAVGNTAPVAAGFGDRPRHRADRSARDLVVDEPVGYQPVVDQPVGDEPVPAVAAKAIGVLGRSLIVTGLLLLAFAGFQLWGTGIAEARAQEELAAEFEAVLAGVDPSSEVPADSPPVALSIQREGFQPPKPASTPTLSPQTPAEPETGDPIGRIVIPAIDVEKTIVEGTTRDALRSGPGRYSSTALPGRSGNAAIAGHRTTHGAPFFDIDQLVPGDEITVETPEGTFTYLVEGQDDGEGGTLGHRIVDPSDVSVIADKGDHRLTLTACHPKYSAEQRIIVTATLLAPPAAVEPPDHAEPQPAFAVNFRKPAQDPTTPSLTEDSGLGPAGPTIDESLGWQRQYAPATLGWAGFTAAIAAVASLLGRFWRRAPAYAMAVPPFLLALYHCFVNLEHLIPAV